MDEGFPGAQLIDFPDTINVRLRLLDISAIIATSSLEIFILNLSPL